MGAAGNKKPKKQKHDKHTPAYAANEASTSVTFGGQKKKK